LAISTSDRCIGGTLLSYALTLGNRNVSFRSNWNKALLEEDGHFMDFLWKEKFDETFKWSHDISKENLYGKYLSPGTQNEVVLCCEQEIRENILN
jgi:hypothetical protein